MIKMIRRYRREFCGQTAGAEGFKLSGMYFQRHTVFFCLAQITFGIRKGIRTRITINIRKFRILPRQ
ncbi:MAG: hypothetical protein U5N56_06795 [Candidatus Marinimicrobia bacterium]|nr:hypothetical protein [Candidatus Neomarinimicrobiota bacterium]